MLPIAKSASTWSRKGDDMAAKGGFQPSPVVNRHKSYFHWNEEVVDSLYKVKHLVEPKLAANYSSM